MGNPRNRPRCPNCASAVPETTSARAISAASVLTFIVSLQGSDSDIAELDRARAILKGNRSRYVSFVLDVNRSHPVQC